jgi:prophage antirepressor-like protein
MQKSTAKRFKKWITSEVIPAIRKTGSYTLPAAPAVQNPVLQALMLQMVVQGWAKPGMDDAPGLLAHRVRA